MADTQSADIAARPFVLRDTSRDPHRDPCPDCGRTHMQGEHVVWTVPATEGGYRVVWSGCCDCWVRRTSPTYRIPPG